MGEAGAGRKRRGEEGANELLPFFPSPLVGEGGTDEVRAG